MKDFSNMKKYFWVTCTKAHTLMCLLLLGQKKTHLEMQVNRVLWLRN